MTARSWLNALLTRPARAIRPAPARPAARPRLGVEPLEDRSVPAVLSSALAVGGAWSDMANDVAVDTAGNSYLTGYVTGYEGTRVDFDRTAIHANDADQLLLTGSGSNGFIAKYAVDGSFLWVRGFGLDVAGTSLAVDGSGNVHASGTFYGTADFDPGPETTYTLKSPTAGPAAFVVKLNTDGGFGWARQVVTNANNTYSSEIAVDGDGNVYTAGSSSGIGMRMYISRHDSQGNHSWTRGIGNSGMSTGSLTTDGTHVYVTGSFNGTVDFDPGNGTYNLFSGGSKAYPNQAAFVLKATTALGDFTWAKHFQTSSNGSSSGEGIALDGQGNVYVTGGFRNTVDFDPGKGTYKLASGTSYLTKLSGSGQFLWAKGFGGYVTDMARDIDGNLYFTGFYTGTVDLDPDSSRTYPLMSDGEVEDVFVLKLDANGNFGWAYGLGGSAKDVGHGIAVDRWGAVSVVGYFWSPSLDGTSLTNNAGEVDLFLVKVK